MSWAGMDLVGHIQKGRRGWEWWVIRQTTGRVVYEGWEPTKKGAERRLKELCK